jgi:ADP-ribosyl-[dinitrogen reductase] hydrolase
MIGIKCAVRTIEESVVNPSNEASRRSSSNPNSHDETTMGLSNGNGRRFRNPSGRTARITPELRVVGADDEVARQAGAEKEQKALATNASGVPIPPPEQDFGWAHVTGSYRREKALEGLLFGAAVGDAVGLGRGGLRRSSILRMFGRGPLNYCVVPGLGVVGGDIQRMHLTLQAVLRSRSQLESFRRGFANRLRCYLLTFPWAAGRPTVIAAIRLCLGAAPDQSGVESRENSPLVSAMAIATVLQGTGHSAERWVAMCTETTHTAPEAVESSVLIARAVYLAVMTPVADCDPLDLISRLVNVTEDRRLAAKLQQLERGLQLELTTHEMSIEMGWSTSVPNDASATALMAIYAWLANHGSFEKTVERAVLLGGDTETLGTLAGGLAAIHLGMKSIPERWLNHLFAWPNGKRWMHGMIQRFIDWPHGSEDLHAAPGMPVWPLLQVARSLCLGIVMGVGSIVKIPWRFFHSLLGR